MKSTSITVRRAKEQRISAEALVDALTGSTSNLHPRHPLYSSNASPKLLEINPLFLKLPPDLLYRLFLPEDDFRVSMTYSRARFNP